MRRILLFLSVFLGVNTLLAQEGAPLLTHFRESRDIENQNWAICQDVNHVMLFANRKGILTFDGQEWRSVRIPVMPFSMRVNPRDGKIYIGGDNSYGILEKDTRGSYKYISLAEDADGTGVITRIIFKDSLVWFYSDQTISRYNTERGTLELRLTSGVDNPFTGMLVNSSNTFINVMDKGLYRLDSDTLFPIVTGYLTEKTTILFSLPYKKNLVLVGLSSGNISLFDGIKYYEYKINDDGYLRDNILSEGIVLNDSLYAFSTLEGGALVVNRSDGKIRYTINNQNELPDDEVFALGCDNSEGLWLSHQYGLTRADLSLPVGNFSIYPGLNGNLTNSTWHNNELYVSTSEGVFYLSEVKNYSEVQVLIKKEAARTEPKVTESPDVSQQQGERKNILSRIFGRIISKDKESPIGSRPVTDTSLHSAPATPQYERKTVNKLKSINYVFRKVDGLNEKCRQLVSTGNGILAATNRGLFVINDHKAAVIADNHYINSISWQPTDNEYYIAAGDGYFSVRYQEGDWIRKVLDPGFKDPVYSIINTGKNTIWLGVDDKACRAVIGESSADIKYTEVRIENDYPQRYILSCVNDSVFLFSESAVYYYDVSLEGFVARESDTVAPGAITRYLYPRSNMPWANHGDEWLYLDHIDDNIEKEMALLKIFNDVISISGEDDILWVIDGENRLFRFDMNKPSKINPANDVLVKSIYDEHGTTFNLTHIVFDRGNNIVNFDIVAPGYLKQNTTRYQYKISKLMPDWSPWSSLTTYNILVPAAGDYTLQVRAKDMWGNIGEPVSVSFTIKAPFTQTTVFYVLIVTIILFLLILFIRFREKQLQRKNKILEEKVKERTAEIAAQKEEITSSIEYASRIQMAMLPMEDHFKTFFSDYFIIFKPRDIVSGDFYWIGEGRKNIFFTVADCTGHGVPGAFMSTLGISTLNEIIANNDDLHANTILNILTEKIQTSLHQTGKEGEAADGMDLAFCVLSKNKKNLQYSGAYNPLFHFRGDEFNEYKADRMPIGIYYGKSGSFSNYDIKVNRGDVIYIFSDGMSDQFGGPDGSKYKKSNLKKLLSDIHNKTMAEQQILIESAFEIWKGSAEQVDDITLIGVRI